MERLSGYQVVMLLGLYIVEITIGPVSAQMIAVAGQDAWLAYLPALALCAAVLWLLSLVQKRFPDQGLMEAFSGRHPLTARVVALLYVPFALLIVARDLRASVDFVNIALLQKTPLQVLTLILSATVVLVVKGGNRALGRLAELFTPVQVVMTLALVLMTGNLANVRLLGPFLEYGPARVLGGGVLAFPFMAESVLVGLTCIGGPIRLRDQVKGLLLGALQLTTLALVNLLILGPQLAHRFMYPNYSTIRQIRITDFLDRWDLFLVAAYYPALLTRLGIDLYIFCRLLAYAFPGVSTRQLATPAGILGLVASLWCFRDAVQVLALNRVWASAAFPFEVVIPVLLFLFLRPAKTAESPRAM